MNDQDPRPRRPIPLLLWALLGFVVVLVFMFTMRALNPPSAGMGPPQPDVILPAPAPNAGPTP
jgi:hypothetical protein